jgi:hypothetical protein
LSNNTHSGDHKQRRASPITSYQLRLRDALFARADLN